MKYLLVFFSLIFLSGCGTSWTLTGTTDSLSDSSKNEIATELDTAEEMLGNIPSNVWDTSEFRSCIKKNIVMCEKTAIMEVSKRTKNTDFCNELKEESQKESCKYALIVTESIEKWDVLVCESLSSPFRESCEKETYKHIALSTHNIKLCEKIAGNAQEECMMSVIIWTPGSMRKDCEKITDSRLKNMCLSTFSQSSKK